MTHHSKHLAGPRIDPVRIHADMRIADLVNGAFLAYNGGRLREASRLFAEKMLDDDVTIGVSLTGALTPAG
ncbi:MAG: deoxyhypusine synthase, partial [Gemmatimonadota bacterium]